MDISMFVEQMFSIAVARRASDIHLQPKEDHGLILFRIDGSLINWRTCTREQLMAIISKLKFIAHLDIGEKRYPQDGSLHHIINYRAVNIRLSTLPTIHGEKLVLRLFPAEQEQLTLAELGFTSKQLSRIEKMLQLQQGLLLVTGPTGAGKTTTIYKMLEKLAEQQGKNIVSLEDPVEMRLPNLTQTQVNPANSFTFATGLRAILRQDPDIIFVGEIRDEETANIAIRASLTGHFVLSTLHTSTSVGAIVRLLQMGVKPYYLASALTGVIAQRLFRLRCSYCEEGCYECFYTGYKGRQGVFEVLPISESIREEIVKGGEESRLRAKLKEMKIPPLTHQMKRHVTTSLTTVEECATFFMAEEWF